MSGWDNFARIMNCRRLPSSDIFCIGICREKRDFFKNIQLGDNCSSPEFKEKMSEMSQPHLQAETISRGLWMSKLALFGFILHGDLSRDFSKTFILGTMCKWTHPSRCSGKRKLHIHNQHIASTSWRCISRKLQWFAQGCSPCGAIILEASSVSAIASPVFETADFVNTPSTDMIKHYPGHYLVQSWPFFDYRRKMVRMALRKDHDGDQQTQFPLFIVSQVIIV